MKFIVLLALLLVGGYLYLNPGVVESIFGKAKGTYESSVAQNQALQ